MPQPNWNKLVAQGRAQGVGIPLVEGVSVFAKSAPTEPKELEPSPLTEEEKAFLAAEEEESSKQEEKPVENAPETVVPNEEATDTGETVENAPIDEKTGETEGNTETSEETEPQKPEESPESNENTVPATGTTAPTEPKAEDMTFAELKKALTDLGQTIPFGANKAKLVEMFNAIP